MDRRQVTGPLGPDALGAGEDVLREALSSSRAALKPALMDQRRVARCPRCGARLASGTVGGRSTRWCPREQPRPR